MKKLEFTAGESSVKLAYNVQPGSLIMLDGKPLWTDESIDQLQRDLKFERDLNAVIRLDSKRTEQELREQIITMQRRVIELQTARVLEGK
jgi:hypothetical protein